MEQHINNICKTAYFHIFNIGKIRRYLTQEAAEQIVHAFITSKLDYCNSLLCGLPAASTKKLQRLQNIAARIVTQSRAEHITPVLHSLHWLPVCQRIQYKVLLLVFKAKNNMAPDYLAELIHPYQPERGLRSAEQHLLVVPFTRSATVTNRAFGVAGPRLWNELPLQLRSQTCLTGFKSKLKTYLFCQYYNL